MRSPGLRYARALGTKWRPVYQSLRVRVCKILSWKWQNGGRSPALIRRIEARGPTGPTREGRPIRTWSMKEGPPIRTSASRAFREIHLRSTRSYLLSWVEGLLRPAWTRRIFDDRRGTAAWPSRGATPGGFLAFLVVLRTSGSGQSLVHSSQSGMAARRRVARALISCPCVASIGAC